MPQPVLTPPPPSEAPVKKVEAPAQVQAPQNTQTPVAPLTPTPQPKSEELIKRMAAEPKKVEAPAEEVPEANLETETDPKVKERIQALEKHYNKRYMELAEQRKKTEEERQSMSTWTPEKIDQVLQNQQFVQAAQTRLQQQAASQAPSNWTGSQEEWSALTPSEKQHISHLESKVNNLLTQQDFMLIQQEDEVIKSRIPNYDPKVVDQLAVQIQQNQIPRGLLRELMWKAKHFDQAVEQSYRYGLEDRNGEVQGKMIASSPTIGSATTQTGSEIPAKGENETSMNWFNRVAKFRLAEAKKSGTYTKK